MSEDKKFDKDNLLEQLDRHLDWIKSCDTKSSIVLAAIGIFLTLFTSDYSINMINEILSSLIQNINFSNLLYLVLCTFFSFLFLYGSYCLVLVLIPSLSADVKAYDSSTHKDSLYYFEDVSKNTFNEYKEKVFNRSHEEEIVDILSQIYVNAKISTRKFIYYSKGIKCTFIGIAGLIVFYIVGIFLVKAGGL